MPSVLKTHNNISYQETNLRLHSHSAMISMLNIPTISSSDSSLSRTWFIRSITILNASQLMETCSNRRTSLMIHSLCSTPLKQRLPFNVWLLKTQPLAMKAAPNSAFQSLLTSSMDLSMPYNKSRPTLSMF